MKKSLLLISMLSLLNIFSSNAQWTSDATLNTPAVLQSECVDPISKADSSGATLISFRFLSGSAYAVGYQKIDSAGYPLWGTSGITLNNSDVTQTYTTVYDATVDANGNGITTYEDSRSGNFDVYASKVYANGQSAWGASGVTLSTGTGTDVNPKVLAMTDSSCIFAWQSDDSTGIYLQRVDAAGNKMWGNGIFYHYQPGELLRYWTYPTLVFSSETSFFLIYRKSNASFNPSQSNLAVMKFDINGQQLLTNPVTMQNIGAFGIILRLKAIPDGNAGFYAAWLDGRNSGFSYDGIVQHLDANGNNLFPTNGVRVSAISTSDQLDGVIPVICNDNFYAVFYNGSGNYISVQKFDVAGNLLFGNAASRLVSTPSLSVNYTQLNAVAVNNGIVVTYAESNQVNNFYYACKSDTVGQSDWSSNRIPVSTNVSSKSNSTLTESKNGKVVLCWQDNRNSQSNIYVQAIDEDGSLGVGFTTVLQQQTEIYPNPTTGKIYGKSLSGMCTVKDIHGRIVLNGKCENNELDLTFLKTGNYFINTSDQVIPYRISKVE